MRSQRYQVTSSRLPSSSLPPCGGGLGWGVSASLPPCGGGLGWGVSASLPPCGGGLGWGEQLQINCLHHGFQLLENDTVPKPQHSKTLRLQPGRALGVMLHELQVLTTVKLDDEFPLEANEIDHERPNRSLSSEPAASKLPLAQAMPQTLFSVGHRFPRVTSKVTTHGSILIFISQAKNPPPQPSPTRGE